MQNYDPYNYKQYDNEFEQNPTNFYSNNNDYNQPTNEHQKQLNTNFQPSIKIYGKKCALTIVGSQTKSGFHTLNIEGADSKGDGSKAFLWNEKVILQLTKTEFRHFLAVLFGMSPSANFISHGPQKNKSIEIVNQGRNFFLSLKEGGKSAKAVPVSFDDAFLLGQYALNVFMKNYENLTDTQILNAVSLFCQMQNQSR